jgi:hypothetical protein
VRKDVSIRISQIITQRMEPDAARKISKRTSSNPLHQPLQRSKIIPGMAGSGGGEQAMKN